MSDAGGIQRPGKIVCVGRNYADHAAELGNVLPEIPLIFLKPPSSVIWNGDPIVLPPESAQVDHEAEIGVVIGSRLRRVSPDEALEGIAGYTCVNDVTARDLQRIDNQWTRAKGFDTFCPVGPRIVSFPDPGGWRGLEIICRVNGEVRQHGHARFMHFGVPELVAYISTVMTLEPGDMIATGTPARVGSLNPGDLVEVEIPGVGVLSNPVVMAEDL
jgi:2-keto-4-pentenoate hydratase/2-oxohepta-3-ene-1,7-dioic acid hydratase in catechol pathway